MKIIFAQGNPGSQYARTRHNVGFLLLDVFADEHSATWKVEKKFNAELATLTLDGERVLLVKPLSYYNETGRVARAIIDFYKLVPETDFLVLHDELALPFGEVRIREKGSDAGNNGIKSLNAHLGQAYARIRIGIWNELRERMDDADFVLSTLTGEEATILKERYNTAVKPSLDAYIHGTLLATTLR